MHPFRTIEDSLSPGIRQRLSELRASEPERNELLERARESCKAQNWKNSAIPLYRDHAIDPVIGDARPYERYDLDNLAPVEDEYRDLHKAARRLMIFRAKAKHAKGYGGHLIKRHVPPGLGRRLPRIPAETRPDEDVPVDQRRWFYRPEVTPIDPKDFPRYPSGRARGKLVPRSRWCALDEQNTEQERERWHKWRDKMRVFWEDRKGLYQAQRMSHYLFPPTPKIWVEIRGRLQRVPDRTKNYAKRIDMHPLAALLAPDAKIVFFCIEGCIKADAILTEILRTRLKATVVSVPSVTLWGPGTNWYDEFPELRLVAGKYFQGKRVIVVCDRDWHTNSLVHDQALFCRGELEWMGVEAYVAAPTRRALPKGVDDHLVAGGTLDELEAELREAPYIVDCSRGWRTDAIRRNARALHFASLHSFAADNTLRKSLRGWARVMRVHHRLVQRAFKQLEAAGYLSVPEGFLETQRDIWRGRYFDRSEQWEDPPTIQLAESVAHAPSLRLRVEQRFVSLAELFPGFFDKRRQATQSAPHRGADMLDVVAPDNLQQRQTTALERAADALERLAAKVDPDGDAILKLLASLERWNEKAIKKA